ncbi:hypothetical protein D9M72_531260 [compost metagenome]
MGQPGRNGVTCAIEQHPRTTNKDARDAEDGPARERQRMRGPACVSPAGCRDQGSERQRLMRSLLRKRFACPACRTARRKGGPAAVGKAARIIGSNFLPQAKIAQQMRNRIDRLRHNSPQIAVLTTYPAISCSLPCCDAQGAPAQKHKRPGGPGRL